MFIKIRCNYMEYKYFNREISWLSYNRRVLDEAADKNLSVKERIRFMAIFASNLDEFYKIKIYAYHNLKKGANNGILKKINSTVCLQQREFNKLLFKSIIPDLADQGIEILNNESITEEQKSLSYKYFKSYIKSKLQPILLSKNVDIPFLHDNTLYLFISLYKKKEKPNAQRKLRFAIVEIPFTDANRFVCIKEEMDQKQLMLIEDIIRLNLDNLLSGYEIISSYSLKMLRNADFQVDDNDEGDIVEKIRDAVSKREIGEPCLLVYDRNMPDNIRNKLVGLLKLGEDEILSAGKYLRLSDLMYFPFNNEGDNYKLTQAIDHPSLDGKKSFFKIVKKEDILLHFPFNSFEYVIQFLNEAAFDRKVEEIKITWYRVARKSAVANALLTAANNGKRVTVFVELKARFDERQNIYFASLMENSGIKIIYTLPGLKVHAKMIFVRRFGKKKGERKYGFLSTGNFNEKTAEIYTDHGLFTSNADICKEISDLFIDIENGKCCRNYKTLLIAPVNLKEGILNKIDREIENCKAGFESGLIFKMNGLQNKKIIDKLYEASIAGVKIELIVRGICCLIPGQLYSKNIRVRRIVDQYLEHGRIYIFNNRGNKEIFMGSADMMTRNLERRIELLFPLSNDIHKREISDIVNIYLADNNKATFIDGNLENISINRSSEERIIRAQYEVMEYIRNKRIEIK